MILPQSIFPSAASQGALGIECKKNRDDNGVLLEKLSRLEDKITRSEVERERKAFNEYGGGCHLAVGVNVKKLSSAKGEYFLHSHRGELEGKEIFKYELEGRTLPTFVAPPKAFLGMPANDELLIKKNIPVTLDKGLHLYITSKYCLDTVADAEPATLWAAGNKTMRDLAQMGLWVNGTSDSIGDEEMRLLRSSKAVGIMCDTNAQLIVLSNDEARSTLTEAEIVACYKREINETVSEDFSAMINSCDVFYWTSFFQYEAFANKFPSIKTKFHCCGVGKTLDLFREKNIDVIAMADISEFKSWTNS